MKYLIASLILLTAAYFMAYDELKIAIQITVALFVLATAIAILGVLLTGGLVATERYRILKADRITREKEAAILTITAPEGHQVYLRDTDHSAVVRPLHLMPGYSNSKAMHNDDDALRWLQYQATRKPQIIKGESKLLAPIEQAQTFYEVMALYPHLLIVGPTGSGKTTQINLAISKRLEQYPDAVVYWLSTHSNLDNPHPAAQVSQQVEDIQAVFKRIFKEYEQRRDSAVIGHHIIVAMDEWPELIDEIAGLGSILRRLSRGGRKCAISLILASHGSSVSDLDIKGHSSVKQDFAEIILNPKLTQQGKAIWQQYNKVSSQVEILLPQRRDMARQLITSGASKNQAARVVYGRGYGGDLVGKF